MLPHLVRWQNLYGSEGLNVVYVDDGRRDSLISAQEMARNNPFTVFHDTSGASNQTYGVQAYPTAYILDGNGRVVWEGIPVFNTFTTEMAILSALGR